MLRISTPFSLLLLALISISQPFPFQTFLHPKEDESVRYVNNFDISRDEQLLATTNSGPSVCVWNVKDGNLVAKVTERDGDPYPLLCRLSNNGKLVSSSGMDGEARIWDLQTGKKLLKLNHNSFPSKVVRTLAFSPDDKTLLTGVEGNLFFWDVETGTLIKKYENVGTIESAEYFPDGSKVFIESSAGLIYDVNKGEIIQYFPASLVRISSDFKRVITTQSADYSTVDIKEWDVASGALISSATQVEFEPGSIVSPDNDFVFYPDKVEKNKIKIRKLKEKSPFLDLNLNAFPALNVEQPYRMELSKKGHFLFLSQGNNAFLYDVRELKSKIKDDKVYDDPPKKE